MKNNETHIYKIFSKNQELYNVIATKTKYISKCRYNILKQNDKNCLSYKIFIDDFDYILLETINDKTKDEIHNKILEHIEKFKPKTREYMGAVAEKYGYTVIKNVFAVGELHQSKFKFSHYDFYDNKFLYELKSRNIKSSDFYSGIINVCKLVDNNIIFVFKYTDGYFYLEYDKELFKTFGRNRQVNSQEVIEIPIRLLTKFNENDKIKIEKKYNEPEDDTNFKKLINQDIKLYENELLEKNRKLVI
jgi:hypothetical protein